MSERQYPWNVGVFNPACVCGGSLERPNPDCERCALHAWVYTQAAEIERLRSTITYAIKQLRYGGTNGGLSERECRTVHDACVVKAARAGGDGE